MPGLGGVERFGSKPHCPKPGKPLEEEPETSSRLRKKAARPRPWMVVDEAGEARVVDAGKQMVMQRTGLPARDLRILDPVLSRPSTILGRESAIVFNIEHVRLIITAREVLLLNFEEPLVDPFVQRLQSKIQLHHLGHHKEQEEGDLIHPKTYIVRMHKGKRDQPFEFVALEACLETTCNCLENEATTLEKEAHLALDKLTSQISTLNLEHVRRIKSRLVAISGRVQKVRDELEHLLDDDDDMAGMYLTQKLARQQLSMTSSSCFLHHGIDDERLPSQNIDNHNIYDIDTHSVGSHYRQLSRLNVISDDDSYEIRSCSTKGAGSKHHCVEELEMLLEAYFVQIDSTLSKLSTLREYVDDTEDYINIMLDDKQNQLLQTGVMLTTATLIVSAFVVVTGIFGMNIKVELFDEKKSGNPEFLWTVGGGTVGSLLLYAIAIAWGKYRRLLE